MTNDQFVREIQQLRDQVKAKMESIRENLRENFASLKHTDNLEAKRGKLTYIERCLASDISLTLNTMEDVLKKIDMTNDQLIREIQQLRDQVKAEMESIRENLRENFNAITYIEGLEAQKRLAYIEEHLAFYTRGILRSIKTALKK